MSSVSGWKTVEFGDIAEQIINRVDNPKKSRLTDYIGLEHIESNNLRISDYGKTDGIVSSKFECKKGDIIFSRRRAYLRKLAISDRDALVSTDAMIIRPKENVSKDFLLLLMQNEKFWNEVIARSAGSLSPRIKWRDLSKICVPLPPLKVREEISMLTSSVQDNFEKTENLFKDTEAAKKALILEKLGMSSKYGEFMHPRIEGVPKGWGIKKIGDLIESVQNGFPSGKRDKNGIVQIRMNNITTDGQLCFDDYLLVPIPKNISRYSLEEGDILFNNTNSIDLVGKSAIFTKQAFECTFSNHFTRIRVRKEIVLPEILLQHLIVWQNAGYFQDTAHRQVGQSSVSIKDVMRLKIFIPTKSEQILFVNTIKSFDSALNKLKIHRDLLGELKKKIIDSALSRGFVNEEDTN